MRACAAFLRERRANLAATGLPSSYKETGYGIFFAIRTYLVLGFVLSAPGVLLSQSETTPPDQSTEPVKVIKSAIENQSNYMSLQKKRACRYMRTVRSDYGTGQSLTRKVRTDEVFFDLGGEAATKPTNASPDQGTTSSTFDIWDHLLFQAVLESSLFKRVRDEISWDGRTINRYEFVPNPEFQPSTDIERVAQGVYGTVSIDQKTQIFVGLHALAMKDIYEGKKLLLLGPRHDAPIPVFSYAAAPYDGIIVPTVWDEASFGPVKRGGNEISNWLATLTRTFVQIQACREYKVKATIKPGFGVLNDQTKPPQ